MDLVYKRHPQPRFNWNTQSIPLIDSWTTRYWYLINTALTLRLALNRHSVDIPQLTNWVGGNTTDYLLLLIKCQSSVDRLLMLIEYWSRYQSRVFIYTQWQMPLVCTIQPPSSLSVCIFLCSNNNNKPYLFYFPCFSHICFYKCFINK